MIYGKDLINHIGNMPTYRYKCKWCKTEVQRIVPIAERNKQTCEKCGQSLDRMYDSFGFVVRDSIIK